MGYKEIIERVLLEFMDGTYRGFEDGHFTHSADPKEVRDRLIEALEIKVSPQFFSRQDMEKYYTDE